jgi:hypothetical protein
MLSVHAAVHDTVVAGLSTPTAFLVPGMARHRVHDAVSAQQQCGPRLAGVSLDVLNPKPSPARHWTPQHSTAHHITAQLAPFHLKVVVLGQYGHGVVEGRVAKDVIGHLHSERGLWDHAQRQRKGPTQRVGPAAPGRHKERRLCQAPLAGLEAVVRRLQPGGCQVPYLLTDEPFRCRCHLHSAR